VGKVVTRELICVKLVDGGYAVVGYTRFIWCWWLDVYLIKTDAMGNEQWNKTFGGQQMTMGLPIQPML